MRFRGFPPSQKGVTLVELAITMAIIGFALLILLSGTGVLHKSIQNSRNKTTAVTLAQEGIEKVKTRPYHMVMISTAVATKGSFSPALEYDADAGPDHYGGLEMFNENGIAFERTTLVKRLMQDGSLAPDDEETGLKQITVAVTWTMGGQSKIFRMKNEISDPTYMKRSTFIGKVSSINDPINFPSVKNNLPMATVKIEENNSWRNVTNAQGNYNFRLFGGLYGLTASARGHFPVTKVSEVGAGDTMPVDFDLVAIQSATVYGALWTETNHLVISQVVGADQLTGGFLQEWIELYNPTDSWILVASETAPGVWTSYLNLYYQDSEDPTLALVPILAPSTFTVSLNGQVVQFGYRGSAADPAKSLIEPHGYYLIANLSDVSANGIMRADAVYDKRAGSPAGQNNLIKNNENGAIAISRTMPTSCSQAVDCLGWSEPAAGLGWGELGVGSPGYIDPQPFIDGEPLNFAVSGHGEQYVRRTSQAGITPGQGPAFDSPNNDDNFLNFYPANIVTHPPHNSRSAPVEPGPSGTPLLGAFVHVNDGLSSIRMTKMMGSTKKVDVDFVHTGTAAYAGFEMPDVATTTSGWRLQAFNQNFSSVTTTSPLLTKGASSYHSLMLSEPLDFALAIVTGSVRDMANNPIDTPLQMSAECKDLGISTRAWIFNVTGDYGLLLPATSQHKTYQITVNDRELDNFNPLYSTHISSVEVKALELTPPHFIKLQQTAELRGKVRRGMNPAPHVPVVAKLSGAVQARAYTDADGQFIFPNLAANNFYTVVPETDLEEVSHPAQETSVTLTPGNIAVLSSTFSVTSRVSRITGSVTKGGKAVNTGLVVVTTDPALHAQLSGGSPLSFRADAPNPQVFTALTGSDGAYNINVPGVGTYYVHVYAGAAHDNKTVAVATGGIEVYNVAW